MAETYTPGYSTNIVNFLSQRSLESHGAFFQPYLKPGMTLLDCGCGPGTITVGLARAIAPGHLVAVDQEASQINLAQENAAAQNIDKIEFVVSSIYQLPFPENTFDGIFCHAVVQHLQDPLQAVQELHRVLKVGGVLGLRAPDWGGFLMAPSHSDVDQAIALYKRLQERNGGNPYVGKLLPSILRQAGFSDIHFSASYECSADLPQMAHHLAKRLEAIPEEDLIALAATSRDRQHLCNALRDWGNHPDALFAQSWCEAIATKESSFQP